MASENGLNLKVSTNITEAISSLNNMEVTLKGLSGTTKTAKTSLENLSKSLTEAIGNSRGIRQLGTAFDVLGSGVGKYQRAANKLNNISLDTSKISSMESSIKGLAETVSNLNFGNSITEISQFGNSMNKIKRMSDSFNVKNFENVIDVAAVKINKFSNEVKDIDLGAIPAQFNTMGNAFKKFGEFGAIPDEKIDSIKKVITELSSIKAEGGLDRFTTFASSIKALANSLNTFDKQSEKVGTTLPKISSAFKDFLDDLEKSPKVRNDILRLSESLATLATRFPKAFSSSSTTSEVIDKLGNSMDKASIKGIKFSDMLSKVRNGLHFLGRAFTFATGINLGQMFASPIDEATEFIENINLFRVSLGEYANEGMGLIEELNNRFGLKETDMIREMGMYFQLANSLGVTQKNAYTLSETFTKLAADISSYYDISIESAQEKLQAGLVGQVKPLRQLGISIASTTLEQEAQRLGIEKSVATMTEAEKIYLRYIAIMNQTENAQGDFARTIESPANRLKILRSQLHNAARTLGQTFIPVLNAVLPYLIAFANALTTVFNKIARIFGYDTEAMMGDISVSVPDLTGISLEDDLGIEDANESIGGLNSGLGQTKKKLEDIKRTVFGWDELNILNAPNEDNYPSGGGGVGGSTSGGKASPIGSFTDNLKGYDNLMSKVDTDFGRITKNILEKFGKIKQALKDSTIGQFVEGVAKVVKWLWNDVLSKFFDWLMERPSRLTFLIDMISSVLIGFLATRGVLRLGEFLTKTGERFVNLGGLGTKFGSALLNAGGLIGKAAVPIGITVAVLGALYGAYKLIKNTVDENRMTRLKDGFGDLAYTAEMSEEAIQSIAGKYEESANKIKESNDLITESTSTWQENHDKFSEILLSIKVGEVKPEDIDALMSAVDELYDSAKKAIDDKVSGGINLMDYLFGADGANDYTTNSEYSEKILTWGKGIKEEADELQKDITDIYQTAMEERGYLLDEELQSMMEKMALQRKLLDPAKYSKDTGAMASARSFREELRSGAFDITDAAKWNDDNNPYVQVQKDFDKGLENAKSAIGLAYEEAIAQIRILEDATDVNGNKLFTELEIDVMIDQAKFQKDFDLEMAEFERYIAGADISSSLGTGVINKLSDKSFVKNLQSNNPFDELKQYAKDLEMSVEEFVKTTGYGKEQMYMGAAVTANKYSSQFKDVINEISKQQAELATEAEKRGVNIPIGVSTDVKENKKRFETDISDIFMGAYESVKDGSKTFTQAMDDANREVAELLSTNVEEANQDMIEGITETFEKMLGDPVNAKKAITNWISENVGSIKSNTLMEEAFGEKGDLASSSFVEKLLDSENARYVNQFVNDNIQELSLNSDALANAFGTTAENALNAFSLYLIGSDDPIEAIKRISEKIQEDDSLTDSAKESAIEMLNGFVALIEGDSSLYDSLLYKATNAANGAMASVAGEVSKTRIKFNVDASVRVNTVDVFTTQYARSEQIAMRNRRTPQYASGGFPEVGQMFIAREAGAEMVGSIGNRTAVANNQQIVQSIAQGVYRATTASMGNLFGAMRSLANTMFEPRMDVPDLTDIAKVYSDTSIETSKNVAKEIIDSNGGGYLTSEGMASMLTQATEYIADTIRTNKAEFKLNGEQINRATRSSKVRESSLVGI